MTDLLDRLDELREKATKAPWGIYAQQPEVQIQTPDKKPLADVNTWTANGFQDAEFIVELVNNYETLAKRLRAAENVAAACEHAVELGYFGDGSSRGYVKQELQEWRKLRGE